MVVEWLWDLVMEGCTFTTLAMLECLEKANGQICRRRWVVWQVRMPRNLDWMENNSLVERWRVDSALNVEYTLEMSSCSSPGDQLSDVRCVLDRGYKSS